MPPRRDSNPLFVIFGFAAILIGLVLYLGRFGKPPSTATASQSLNAPAVQEPSAEPEPQALPRQARSGSAPNPGGEMDAEPVMELVQGRPESPAQEPPAGSPSSGQETDSRVVTAPLALPSEVLIEAAATGDIDALRAQLRSGTDVNSVDSGQQSALMHAAAAGQLQAVFLLLDYGGDPQLEDAQGRTAADHADAHPDIQRVLRGAGTPQPEPDPTK